MVFSLCCTAPPGWSQPRGGLCNPWVLPRNVVEEAVLWEGQWARGLLPISAPAALHASVLGFSQCPLFSLMSLEIKLSRALSLLTGLL